MFKINPQVVFVINNKYIFQPDKSFVNEKGKQEMCARDHVLGSWMEISTVLSLKVVYLPHFSD